MAHSLVNAIDNDVGTLFQSQCTCIDDHVVITCVGPASASVLEIVVVSSGVTSLMSETHESCGLLHVGEDHHAF